MQLHLHRLWFVFSGSWSKVQRSVLQSNFESSCQTDVLNAFWFCECSVWWKGVCVCGWVYLFFFSSFGSYAILLTLGFFFIGIICSESAPF